MQKLGINTDHFESIYTMAGTNWEHRILDSLGLPGLRKDAQFINEELRLRVNLDGNLPDRIKEVKTYQWEKGFKVPAKYRNQVQVQMFGSNIFGADIVAYGLQEEDYRNFLRDIDPGRRQEFPVPYDRRWIETVYLPKHFILADCLKRGSFPNV